MKKIALFVLMFLVCTTTSIDAQALDSGSNMPPPSPGMSEGGNNRPMRPIPQEAIQACLGKAEGASCQAGPAGGGICSYTPDKKYFACKPNKMRPGSLPRDSSTK